MTSSSRYARGLPISPSPSEPLRRGHRLIVELERLAPGAGALGHAPDGRVIFARGVPGDVVEVELTSVKRRLLRGRVIRRVADSPRRAPAFCAIADRCGGCLWHGAPLEAQRETLVEHVGRLLTRAVGAVVVVPIEGPAPSLGWRSTARLSWRDGQLGYRARGGNEVVPVSACPALAAPLPALLEAARLGLGGALAGEGTLRLTAAPGAPSGTVAVEAGGGPALREALAALVAAAPICHGAVWPGPPREVFGRPESCFGVANTPHPADAFVQAHRPGADLLVEAVAEALGPPGPLLELFAGSGGFTLPLATAGHRIVAVERQPEAAAALQAEANRRGLPVRVHVGEASQLPAGSPRTALIDPPRAGAAAVVAALHAQGVARLVYVACDAATLARDVGWLAARGWALDGARAFDLFPHTGHVETLVTLSRRP